MKKCGIYSITSAAMQYKYIGSATNIRRRINDHLSALNRNKHHSKTLQECFNSYGISDFSFSIIEECSRDLLLIREQFWLTTLNPFFNLSKTAGSNKGVVYPVGSRSKTNSLKGTKRPYSVTIYKAGENISSKKIIRLSPDGEQKIYESLSSVSADGFIFQNVHRAIKRGHKHKGYKWHYD